MHLSISRFTDASVTAEVEPRSGERWRIVTVPLPVGGEGARMAVIEDVSEVVRSNRLEAWAEMARIIAHEIKNPLTPIRLSVEHLREVWRRSGGRTPEFERVLEECVSNVLRQTEELKRAASEFSDYARLPRPEMGPTDVARVIRDSAAAFAGAPGVRWTVAADPELLAEADPRLLARVLSNLSGNAVDALSGGGGEIRLSVERREGRIVVTVDSDTVDRGQLAIHEPILRGVEVHEVAIVPDQIGEEQPRLLGHSDGGFAGDFRRELPAEVAGREGVRA